MSSNVSNESGSIIVLNPSKLSCYNNLNIFNSLSVLYINILCSNAFSIFLIATKLLSGSSASRSFAATTKPYAP